MNIYVQEPSDPSDWNIDETITSISRLDPSLKVHVDASFRTHEKGTIMGLTQRSRIQQQIVSRRRTQFSSKEVEAKEHN